MRNAGTTLLEGTHKEGRTHQNPQGGTHQEERRRSEEQTLRERATTGGGTRNELARERGTRCRKNDEGTLTTYPRFRNALPKKRGARCWRNAERSPKLRGTSYRRNRDPAAGGTMKERLTTCGRNGERRRRSEEQALAERGLNGDGTMRAPSEAKNAT